jgi:hypothetical protein
VVWEQLRHFELYEISDDNQIRKIGKKRHLKIGKKETGHYTIALDVGEPSYKSCYYPRVLFAHRFGLKLNLSWVVLITDRSKHPTDMSAYTISTPARRGRKFCGKFTDRVIKQVTKFPKTESYTTMKRRLGLNTNQIAEMRRRYITFNGDIHKRKL